MIIPQKAKFFPIVGEVQKCPVYEGGVVGDKTPLSLHKYKMMWINTCSCLAQWDPHRKSCSHIHDLHSILTTKHSGLYSWYIWLYATVTIAPPGHHITTYACGQRLPHLFVAGGHNTLEILERLSAACRAPKFVVARGQNSLKIPETWKFITVLYAVKET